MIHDIYELLDHMRNLKDRIESLKVEYGYRRIRLNRAQSGGAG